MGAEISGSNLVIEKEQEAPNIVEIEITDNQPKKRGRPPKSKEETTGGGSTGKDVKKLNTDITSDLSMLLTSLFGVVSLKAGGHWSINKEEADSIAKPLSNIFNKYNLVDKVNSVSDPLALIIATGTIVAPRVLMTKISKEKKIEKTIKNNGGMENAKAGSNTGNSAKVNGNSGIENQSSNTEFIKSLSSEVY